MFFLILVQEDFLRLDSDPDFDPFCYQGGAEVLPRSWCPCAVGGRLATGCNDGWGLGRCPI
jgi:hypothetical protein